MEDEKIEGILSDTVRLQNEALKKRKEAQRNWMIVAGILGAAIVIDAVRSKRK